VESKDMLGWTPLLWAAENGHEAEVRLLLTTGDVDIDSDKDGEIPQFSAAAEEEKVLMRFVKQKRDF
jgi:ankyrin repeat protein